MSAPLDEEVADAEHELRQAAALAREYGVDVITRIVRTRNIGQAIVEEAERRRSEIIVHGRARPAQGRPARCSGRASTTCCETPTAG